MGRRIAFDLDETLGVPQIADNTIIGFHLRPGCAEPLDRLQPEFVLCLRTVSQRRYLDQILSFGLGRKSISFCNLLHWLNLHKGT
jgi:hypothetical protein